MKKTAILLSIMMMLLCSCSSNTKTVKTREEAKQMVESFYQDLYEADQFTVDTYSNGTLFSSMTKDGDKMYVNNVDAGYDYYMFMEEGKKYVISSDRTLFEDESTYDLNLDSIKMMLQMNAMAYFETTDESISYTAVNKEDKELTLTITVQNDGKEATITSTGLKEDGRLNKFTSEMKNGDSVYNAEYRFTYDQHVELPEYKKTKTYDDMPHVESPYRTYGEIIDNLKEDEGMFYNFYDNELIVIGEKDGRHYQFSSVVDQSVMDAYDALDPSQEDYDKKVDEMIYDLPIDDCIDFTDELMSQDQLNSYIGKTAQTLIDEGFEINGHAFWDDNNFLFMTKDMMTYKVDVQLPEGFDIEADHDYEDFYAFEIKDVTFDSVEFAALPMR